MRIEVEPQQLIDAGKQVGSLGEQLSALSDAMSQVLSGGIASGSDPAGLNFGIGYGRQADDFAKGLADAANAFKSVGVLLEATGYNYRNADAASAPGGPGPAGGGSGDPAQTAAGDAPYGPNGTIVPPPTKWWLITPFLRMIPGFGIMAGAAMTWPTGNAAMMNLTAAQWRNIGQGLTVFEPALAAAKGLVDAQDIPEKGTIKSALADLGTGVKDLAAFASGFATTISDFAAGVQETQDAIRSLLDRISVGGLVDTVTGFLTGDGDKVLREIAEDVSTVLENFQNQVKGVMGLLDELKTLLGEAADSFQKWIRPVLVGAFGEGLGNRLADGVKLYTDIQVGAVSGLIGLVSGTVALADADTWKGLAETAVMLAQDPSKAPGVLAEMGSQFIALEQWQGDNPGRGFGEAAFNVGSLFVPGGALAKGGAVAKGLSGTRHLLDKVNSGSLSKLPGLGGNRTPDMPRLPDTPGAPDIPAFDRPPGIPESVLTPGGSDAPMRPQSVDPGAGTPSSASPGSGAGGGHAPTGDSPNGSGPGSSNGGASGGGSPSGGSAPTGGSPNGGGDGPSSNAPVPTGGSASGGSGSGPDGGAPSPAPATPSTDTPSPIGSSSGGGGAGSGDAPSGNGDGPGGASSSGSGSVPDGGSLSPDGSADEGPRDGGDSELPGNAQHPVDPGSPRTDGDGRIYSMTDGSSHQTSFAPEQLVDNQRVTDALERHGVSRSDFIDLVQRPTDTLTPDDRNLINAVRDDLPSPGPDTVMQKVIPPGYFDADGNFHPSRAEDYLNPPNEEFNVDGVGGSVTVAGDTSHLGTPGQIHDGLRLDYIDTPYSPNDAGAHIIRFQADLESPGTYDVPRNSDMGGSNRYDSWDDPFTGNGFTKSGDDIIPEYFATGTRMRDGAEMWEVLDDGTQRLVAVFRGGSWLKQGNHE